MRQKPGYFWCELDRAPWVEESAGELHALFLRYQSHSRGEAVPWSKEDENRYCVLLGHVVHMMFARKGWFRSLLYEHLDPKDVMQSAIFELVRVTQHLEVRVKGQGYRPLLALLFGKVNWHILTAVKESKKRAGKRPVNMTDFARLSGEDGLAGDFLEAPRSWANIDCPELADVAAFAHSDEARDLVIGDIPTSSQSQADAIDRLFDILLETLLSEHDTVPFVLLPPEIQQEITNEQHALVLARLLRTVRSYAA